MSFPTLAITLAARCASSRALHYIDGESSERTLPFSEIQPRALGLLHHFQAHGATAGSEMLLLLESNDQFIDAFWACMLGGIIAIPLAPGINDEHRRKFFRVSQQLKRPHLCTDSKTFSRLKEFAATNELLPELERLEPHTVFLDRVDDISVPGKAHDADPDDIAFVQYSSGSTSEPKGVTLSHRNLLTNIEAIALGMKLTPQDIALSWMPLTHDMGLIGFHLTWLVMDIEHYLMPTALFVRRPALWLLKASEKHATLLCSPNFGYKHYLKTVVHNSLSQLDLKAVRLVFNGAEPISIELCREFLTTLEPTGLRASSMFTVYGLAEASLAVSFPPPEIAYRTITARRDAINFGKRIETCPDTDPNSLTLACVGHALLHCDLRIADDSGAALPELTVGRVLIRGDNVTRGYYQNPQASESAISHDGWLDTGDLGFIGADGLVIAGRRKEIIFVNGQNYYPQDLETLLDRHAGIELGKSAFGSARAHQTAADEVLAFVLHRGQLADFPPIALRARKCINEQTGIVIDHVIPVAKIPKTTSGKIQRFMLADAYQHGEYNAVLTQLRQLTDQDASEDIGERSKIETHLKEICDAYLTNESVGLHDNIFEVGTSSLMLAQIYQRIEAIYPGKLEVTDFFDYPTIAELAVYLEKRLAED